MRPISLVALTTLLAAAACSSGAGALKPDSGAGAGGRDAGAAGTGGAGSSAGTTGGAGMPAPPLPEGGADSIDGGPPCTGPAPFDCGEPIAGAGPQICGDWIRKAVCDNGTWTCPPGNIDARMCKCFAFPPPGCTRCTDQGWACSDAGTDLKPEAGADVAGPDAHDAADASMDACDVGCKPATHGNFCQPNEVTWECGNGPRNAALFNASCHDAGTGAVRYCCPPTFLATCH